MAQRKFGAHWFYRVSLAQGWDRAERASLAVTQRKRNFERCASSRRFLDPDASVQLVHQLLGDRKTQSRAGRQLRACARTARKFSRVRQARRLRRGRSLQPSGPATLIETAPPGGSARSALSTRLPTTHSIARRLPFMRTGGFSASNSSLRSQSSASGR